MVEQYCHLVRMCFKCCPLKLMPGGTIILVFGYAFLYMALDLYGGKILSSGTGELKVPL